MAGVDFVYGQRLLNQGFIILRWPPVVITQEMSIKNTLIHSRSFLETKKTLYPFSDRNGANTVPFGAAHSYMAHIREHPPPLPPAPGEVWLEAAQSFKIFLVMQAHKRCVTRQVTFASPVPVPKVKVSMSLLSIPFFILESNRYFTKIGVTTL